MQKFNKINEPDYNFLDVKIENGRTILSLHHKICNNDFQIEQYNFFKIGQRCGFCRAKRISDTKTISNDEFNKRIYELVKDEYYVISKYSGRHKAVKFIHTVCGHEFDMDAGNFLQGQRCPQCAWDIRSEKLAFSQEEFLERCYSNNRNIEVFGKYKNSQSRIKVQCLICNHIWHPQASRLAMSNPTGCPKCAIKNNTGENNCNWAGGISEIMDYLRNACNRWKYDSFNLYKKQCVITNEICNVVVHHLNVPFSKIVYECFKETNIKKRRTIAEYSEDELKLLSELCLKKHYDYGFGVVLNRNLHNEFHNIYGRNNNTKEQFVEFALRKGKEFKDAKMR